MAIFHLFLDLGILVGIVILFLFIRKLINSYKVLLGLAADTARQHNLATYNFANYVVTDLSLKAKERDLTKEEQEQFHDCRTMLNDYECLRKAGKA